MPSVAVSLVDVDRPLRALLDWAARMRGPSEVGDDAVRADGVQLDTVAVRPEEFTGTARRQLRHTLDERSLRLSGLFVPTRRSLADPEQLDRRLGAIVTAMPLAYELGARAVVVRLGRWPSDEDGPQRLARVLKELAEAGDVHGTPPTLVPTPGTLAPLAGLLGELEAPVAVQFDPTAAVFADDPPADRLLSLAGSVTQLTLRDGRREGFGEAAGVETVLGRGEVDWDVLAAVSHDVPALEWLVLERREGGQRSVDLTSGVSFARRVFMM